MGQAFPPVLFSRITFLPAAPSSPVWRRASRNVHLPTVYFVRSFPRRTARVKRCLFVPARRRTDKRFRSPVRNRRNTTRTPSAPRELWFEFPVSARDTSPHRD